MKLNRTEGIIPPLTRQFSVHNVLYFDTETEAVRLARNSSELHLKLGWAIHVVYDHALMVLARTETPFFHPQQFVNLLVSCIRPGQTLYVIAHNIQFDLQVLDLISTLSSGDWSLDLPLMSQWCFLMTAHYRKNRVLFMDSMNIFPMSLEKLGESVGYEKGTFDPLSMSDSALSAYCYRDTQILEESFHHYFTFIAQHRLGYFSGTLAWQAMTAYRTRFMTKPIHIHVDRHALKLERDAYHGGRTECFFIGQASEEMWFMIDVNSMYPAIMGNTRLPNKLIMRIEAPSTHGLLALTDIFYCIARVVVETNEPVYPAKQDKMLMFPIGTFECVLHDAEFRYAIAHGHLRKVIEIGAYQTDWLFEDYVDFFVDQRKLAQSSGNKAFEIICKLLANSLYGKFGQQQIITEKLGKSWLPGCVVIPVTDLETGHSYTEWHWFGKRYLSAKVGEKFYTSPALAGAITAEGRMFLWNAIKRAGEKNVLYCDTDSLIVNYTGLESLQDLMGPDQLGKFKLVNMSDNVRCFGPKDYIFGRTITFKGLKAGSIQVGSNLWEVQTFRGLRKAIKVGETGRMLVNKTTKSRKSEYLKGDVDEKTGWVTPKRWRL